MNGEDSLPAQETHRMSAKESTEAVDFVPAQLPQARVEVRAHVERGG